MKLFNISFFILCGFTLFLTAADPSPSNTDDPIPLTESDVAEIVKAKKEKAADYFCDLIMPKNADYLLSLIAHQEAKVRKWAVEILKANQALS